MAKHDAAAGASKSLNKTITEIMKHLGDKEDRPRKRLREYLHEKIGDLSEHWFKRGFNRGHIESRKQFKETKTVPRKLKYDCSRKLSPGQNREIELESTIKRHSKRV